MTGGCTTPAFLGSDGAEKSVPGQLDAVLDTRMLLMVVVEVKIIQIIIITVLYNNMLELLLLLWLLLLNYIHFKGEEREKGSPGFV